MGLLRRSCIKSRPQEERFFGHNRNSMFIALLALATTTMERPDWTPSALVREIKDRHSLDAAEHVLADWFGGPDRLKTGADPKFEDLSVAWAIQTTPKSDVRVRSVGGFFSAHSAKPGEFELKLTPAGKNGLFVGAKTIGEGDAMRWQYFVDGKPVGGLRELEVYTSPPESKPAPKKGILTQQPPLTSAIFGGTKHDWWIYTSPGLDPAKESNLVVIQDGQWAHNYDPAYFDNLCGKGELLQTVVVFVTPGTFPDGKSDRSREYDSLNDSYVRFLLEELLPPVEAKYKITADPMRRCVAGLSSGGICSFTCAWQRPDKFGLVLTWIGSFADIASGPTLIEGGHNYPSLIRKSPPKPIHVFLQDGENDLDNVHGNWPLCNHQMVKALEFGKYDVRWAFGNGFHSDKHGRAILADSLRWLFRR